MSAVKGEDSAAGVEGEITTDLSKKRRKTLGGSSDRLTERKDSLLASYVEAVVEKKISNDLKWGEVTSEHSRYLQETESYVDLSRSQFDYRIDQSYSIRLKELENQKNTVVDVKGEFGSRNSSSSNLCGDDVHMEGARVPARSEGRVVGEERESERECRERMFLRKRLKRLKCARRVLPRHKKNVIR
jgi:hypothetical protein